MTDWSQYKIFFPGPTWVSDEVRAAMAAQVLHHRTPEYRDLHRSVITGLRRVMQTSGPVFLVTASGTGCMEAAVRNLSRERVLAVANGAFGERLHQIAIANGREADLLDFPWGRGIDLDRLDQALRTRRYDLVTVVHNETSTGTMNALGPIADLVRAHPDTLLAVDAVSSLGGVPIAVDALGLDFVFAGVQKCFALPPGLSVASASARAIERAHTVPTRGTYFDLVALARSAAEDETPFTPSVPHVAALRVQLERIEREGIDNRHARHLRMADLTRSWAERHFALFAEAGHRSDTVTAIENTRGLDLGKVLAALRARGFICANGYGKLKGKTFRIGHMGDLTVADVEELLVAFTEVIGGEGSR